MMVWPGALPCCVALPLAGAVLAFLLPRRVVAVGLCAALATAAGSALVVANVAAGGPLRYAIGGWGAPLGIELAADGLSALMLAATAAVGLAVSVHARDYLLAAPAAPKAFWPLWLFLWSALNALFLSADLFNVYVTLELMGLSAVALVALAGGAAALAAAMRYLLVSLLGSLGWLLGVSLLYHATGTLDLELMTARAPHGLALAVPLGAMTAGLLLKTGLFPFHAWLPPAHGSAPAPVSALLSALVIKASFYLLLRLWFAVAPAGDGLSLLLGVLGAAAVLWGSVQALRQRRLKLLVAYSTVAQLGYLFLAFPLGTELAWRGAVYLALSHALAKGAMFLAAGCVTSRDGDDDIGRLDRVAQGMPLTLAAFALAGISLAGLPPSGGFVGKWLLLQAAFEQGQYQWAVVLLAGGLLTAAYVFRVVGYAFMQSPGATVRGAPATMQWAALLLAFGAVALGFLAPWAAPLLDGVVP